MSAYVTDGGQSRGKNARRRNAFNRTAVPYPPPPSPLPLPPGKLNSAPSENYRPRFSRRAFRPSNEFPGSNVRITFDPPIFFTVINTGMLAKVVGM